MSNIQRIAKAAFEKYAALYKAADGIDTDPRYYTGYHAEQGEYNPYNRALLENAGFTPDMPVKDMRALGVVPRGDQSFVNRINDSEFNTPAATRNAQISEYLKLHNVQDPEVAAFLRQWMLHQGNKTFNAWDPETRKFKDGKDPVESALPNGEGLPVLPNTMKPFNLDEEIMKGIPDSVRKTLPTQLHLLGNKRPGFNSSTGIPS